MVLHIWDEFHFLKTRDSGTISDMGCVYRAMTSACMYPLTSRLTRPHPSPRAGNIFRGCFRDIKHKIPVSVHVYTTHDLDLQRP